MIKKFEKYICSNCCGNCEKRIIICEEKEIKSAKCLDYKRKIEPVGYKQPIVRTVKQIKPIMRLTQEW